MYVLVDKDNVLKELNNEPQLYVVDVPTLRVMECANMTLQAVKSFMDKPEAVFLKAV